MYRRHLLQMGYRRLTLGAGDSSFLQSQFHRNQIDHRNLNHVGLGRGNRNLRAGVGVQNVVHFPCYGGTDHIYNANGVGAFFLREAQRGEGVCRLPGL